MRLNRLNQLIEDGKAVKGRWEITPNHEVQYRSAGKNEEIKIKGSLVAAEPDALVISVTEKQADQTIVTSIAKLSGKWRLDPKNRIVFEAERGAGKRDALTLKGAWQVGKTNEIVYSYEQRDLKTKKKRIQKLSFSGHWDISDSNRLTYFLGGGSDSAFRFRGAFETQGIRSKKGEIRYQVGAEAAGKHKIQTIVLFGKWKVSRDLGVSFEIEYADGKKRAIGFSADFPLKDGDAFLMFKKFPDEVRAEAGMKLAW